MNLVNPHSLAAANKVPTSNGGCAVVLIVCCHLVTITGMFGLSLIAVRSDWISLPLWFCITATCLVATAGLVYAVRGRPAGPNLLAGFDFCLLAAGVTMLLYSIDRALRPLPAPLYNTDDGPAIEAFVRQIVLWTSGGLVAVVVVLLVSAIWVGGRFRLMRNSGNTAKSECSVNVA